MESSPNDIKLFKSRRVGSMTSSSLLRLNPPRNPLPPYPPSLPWKPSAIDYYRLMGEKKSSPKTRVCASIYPKSSKLFDEQLKVKATERTPSNFFKIDASNSKNFALEVNLNLQLCYLILLQHSYVPKRPLTFACSLDHIFHKCLQRSFQTSSRAIGSSKWRNCYMNLAGRAYRL